MKAFSTAPTSKFVAITIMILVVVIVTAAWLAYLLAISENINSPQSENYGRSATINGKIVCLPYKNTSAEHTLECAIGLHGDSGDFYGLKGLDQERLISGEVVVSKSVEVTSILLAPTPNEKYDIAGTIDLTHLEIR